jgi:hypothetical protein
MNPSFPLNPSFPRRRESTLSFLRKWESSDFVIPAQAGIQVFVFESFNSLYDYRQSTAIS